MRINSLLLPIALLSAAPGHAQSASDLLSQLGGKAAGGGGAGGLGAALGGTGANNITGLLGYCLKNQLLGAAGWEVAGAGNAGGAASVLGKLTGKQGVTQSPGFLAGKQGVVQTGNGGLPLGSLGDGIKQQLCRQVLTRAQGFAGR